MKRKTREATDEGFDEVVSKKQIIEEEQQQEVVVPTKTASKTPLSKTVSYDDEVVPVRSTKTPSKTTKTPKKLPSTTPRKKADRTIYAPSLDTTSRDVPVVSETDSQPLPHVSQKPKNPRGPITIEKKKPTVTITSPSVVKKELLPSPADPGIDLLNLIDILLFGASWFIFGMIAVWFVLLMVQPPLAITLQTNVLDIFDLITNSYGNFFVVEISSFVLTLLAFHFVLSLIMSLVDEQK